MTEPVTIGRPPSSSLSRPRSRKSATVSATALAQDLDCRGRAISAPGARHGDRLRELIQGAIDAAAD